LLLGRGWVRTSFLTKLIAAGAGVAMVIGARAAFIATVWAYYEAHIVYG
jgi:hypothetical protein